MWALSYLAGFGVVCGVLGLTACRTSVSGHYELDLPETRLCVEKSALEHPEDAKMKAETLKMLSATRVDVVLDEAGKMSATTVLTANSPATSQKREGTWQADGKRIVIKVDGEDDTVCEQDGKRLRCQKPMLYKLFSSYVLVRK